MPFPSIYCRFNSGIKVRWPENLRCQGVACGEGLDQIFLILWFFLIKEKEQIIII